MAGPRDDVALHDVGRMDLHVLIGLLDHGPIEQPVSLRTGLPEMPLTERRRPSSDGNKAAWRGSAVF